MLPKLLSSPQVCNLVGKSQGALRQAVYCGKFPKNTHRDGNKPLWSEECIQAWMDSIAAKQSA